MTVTTEVRLPFGQRLRFLFSGRLYAQAILEPSWYVHLKAHRGQAWVYGQLGNIMIDDLRVHGETNGTTTFNGCTLTAVEVECEEAK